MNIQFFNVIVVDEVLVEVVEFETEGAQKDNTSGRQESPTQVSVGQHRTVTLS